MARKELAATLTSSAVGRSVTTTGVPWVDDRGEGGAQLLPRPTPMRRRRPAGRGAWCRRRRSPRAGTPGSRRARRPLRRGPSLGERGEPGGGADRDGGLADDQRACGAGAAASSAHRRCRHRSGQRRREPGCWGVPTQMKWTSPNSAASAKVGGEPQPAGLQRLGEQLGQAGLEERHLARRPAARSCLRRRRRRGPRSPSTAMQIAWVAPR